MIKSTNARDDGPLKQRYVYTGSLALTPVYVNAYTGRAFWFNEFWFNGDLSNLYNNKSNMGFVVSTSNTQCPDAVSEWEEAAVNNTWIVNNDVKVDCVLGIHPIQF